ncbi:hypothetical protein F5878DRAFT_609706 [Lentinula raphanica]|uniref:DUF6589 domain-containing protein n=1 Tax=Lentinula raphanica TaxID=153919 RepID=A0AA38UHI9_9AGAR|nr:hypothetical protein F5878DRAFT_609706 [Lentinula raphanica]
MSANSTIHDILRGLGEEERLATRAAGTNPQLWGKVVFADVQVQPNFLDGPENDRMSAGIAATFIEYAEGTFPPQVNDLNDKEARISKNERSRINARFFLKLINHKHLETVGTIQWLESLVTQIPELAHLKEHVTMLYETKGAIDRLPLQVAKLHCLPTVDRLERHNEDVERVHSAVRRFLEQLGQTPESFNSRIWPFGSHGLSHQRLLELKNYQQFLDNELLRFDIIEPQLEWWHTMSQDLSRLYKTHWGTPLSRDPSSLGHSSRKIGREDPSNLDVIDYFPGTQLAYLVLDARMLDCWRLAFGASDIYEYFRELEVKNELPAIEDLESMAGKLYSSYSTGHAYYRVLYDAGGSKTHGAEWIDTIPVGTLWTGLADDPQIDDVDLTFDKPKLRSAKATDSTGEEKNSTRKDEEAAEREKERFRTTGDRVLANSIAFMRDALWSRECAYAVTSGDVGRAWEILKVMLFTFAGSHPEITFYLLETIASLELESSQPLRNALLRTMLINLSGNPDNFFPCDLVQEYFNRLLEFIVERKGEEFHLEFIKESISRNLNRMSQFKVDTRIGAGLSRHPTPEIRMLLKQYAHHELHSRRVGRYVEERDVDDFSKGWSKLTNGRVAKWIRESHMNRLRQENFPPDIDDLDFGDDSGPDINYESNEEIRFKHTLDFADMFDSTSLMRLLDFEGAKDTLGAGFDEFRAEAKCPRSDNEGQ